MRFVMPTWSARACKLAAPVLAVFLTTSAAHADPALVERMDITSRPITQFRIGSAETRFGALDFVGGLEMVASNGDFGALSAVRFRTPGADFVGVADTGFWFFGTVARDAAGKPTGFSNFRMVPMVDAAGKPLRTKFQVDAESLDVKGAVATVGFERDHRIAQFKLDPDDMRAPVKLLKFLIPKNELRQNKGFECLSRGRGKLEGNLVVVTERSLDDAGNILAAIIEGPAKGVFTVLRHDEFDVSDCAFLADGDLLLLERSYTFGYGVRVRLRRLPAASIAKGGIADGPVVFSSDMNDQIDNMEGLDVWTRADGATMVSMVSDDNYSFLQRNLYLEFVLHDD